MYVIHPKPATIFWQHKSFFMTIEFQTPYGKVSEKLLTFIRSELLELTHIHKKIKRAEVVLREEVPVREENKVCAISLSIYGASLFARSCSESFEQSVKAAIKDLKQLVTQQVKQKEVSEQVFSPAKK